MRFIVSKLINSIGRRDYLKKFHDTFTPDRRLKHANVFNTKDSADKALDTFLQTDSYDGENDNKWEIMTLDEAIRLKEEYKTNLP